MSMYSMTSVISWEYCVGLWCMWHMLEPAAFQPTDSVWNQIKSTPMQQQQPRDCLDILLLGYNTSSIYTVYYSEGNVLQPVRVYCDLETDGGGWLVFQRRMDGSTRFYRTWDEYRRGFGDLDREFWLGNYALRMLAASKGRYCLRIDLTAYDGDQAFAEYEDFRLGGEGERYDLVVGRYSGDAGNSLLIHNATQFSTKDRDHDNKDDEHCAKKYYGGWWYSGCHQANLNGRYLSNGRKNARAKGVSWLHFKGHETSLKFTEMKIRPMGQIGN